MSRLAFFRGHGLGNDYLAVDEGDWELAPTPPLVRLLCDRHVGIGSDGLLLGVPSDQADFGVRIFNPDGSEAEKSGNGLRIFAAFLLDRRRVDIGVPFSVETRGGLVRMEVQEQSDDGVLTVEVEMGRASFRSGAVGLRARPGGGCGDA